MLSFIGFLAAACTTFSFLPQAVKTIRTKATKGISLTMYVLFTIGVSFWLVYGILQHDLPIIVANTVTLAFAGIVLVMKLKYG